MKFTLLILSSLIFITGCSLNKGLSDEEKNLAFQNYLSTNNIENVSKITTFTFRGWSSLTNDYLILSSSHKRQYLIELAGFCSEISWANTLIINRSSGSSLYARFDSVSTPNEPRIKCMIKSIYPITEEQEDEIKNLTKSKEERLKSINEPEKKSPDL
jgi:hypothetical protein